MTQCTGKSVNNYFYIYLHIKKTNGEPFYIGKGCSNRCSCRQNRSKHWKNIINKYDYDVVLLEENLTEEEAFNKEVYWINRIGRNDLNKGPLVNFTNGGEGSSGRPMSIKTKEILKSYNIGKPTSKHQKEIVGNRYKNKFGSEHNRSKMVLCIETGDEFESMSQAEKYYKLGGGSVSWSVKHKRPIYGMHFEIKE